MAGGPGLPPALAAAAKDLGDRQQACQEVAGHSNTTHHPSSP